MPCLSEKGTSGSMVAVAMQGQAGASGMEQPRGSVWLLLADLGGTNVRLRVVAPDGALHAERDTIAAGSEGGTLQETLIELGAALQRTDVLNAIPDGPREIVIASRGFTVRGFRRDSTAYLSLEDVVRRVRSRKVTLVPDGMAGYLGALGNTAGVVVSVGTGTIAVAVDRGGRARRLDGLGPLLGDAGSGYWVGLRGLRCACLWLDRRPGGSSLLFEAAKREFGEPANLPYVIAGGERIRSVSGFAASVVSAARDGDACASQILDAAAQGVAALAVDAAAQAGDGLPLPIVITGGFVIAVPEYAARIRGLLEGEPGASEVLVKPPAVLDGCSEIGRHGVPRWLRDDVEEIVWQEMLR